MTTPHISDGLKSMPFVVTHIANPELQLFVQWLSPYGAIPFGGVPAVCVRDRHFYAGEILDSTTLAAVDMFSDYQTAVRNAMRRDPWHYGDDR